VWYIGANTSTTCGRGTGAHISAIGVVMASMNVDGRSLRMIFGVPVEPLLQMPFMNGDTASGRSGPSTVALASIQSMSLVST
jgi:hypothetical protein